jgi:hypothetical protein
MTDKTPAFDGFLKDFAQNLGRFQKGADVLAGIRDADVDVGATRSSCSATSRRSRSRSRPRC